MQSFLTYININGKMVFHELTQNNGEYSFSQIPVFHLISGIYINKKKVKLNSFLTPIEFYAQNNDVDLQMISHSDFTNSGRTFTFNNTHII